MKNTISKSKVMKAAWTIYNKSYKNKTMANWSKALKRAWAWAKKVLTQIDGVINYTVVRETEKAICIAAQMVCHTTDQSARANFWCPKSIIKNGVIPSWFLGKKEEEQQSRFSYTGKLSLELI